jgi:glycosyltransferase involved in cell wall biosynthesis
MTATPTVALVPDRQARTEGRSGSLRIAMIAPPYFSVPPDGYGGVEMVVADLVNTLVDFGHQVTLIGAGGSHGTKAQRFLSTTEDLPTGRLGEVIPEVAHAARVADLLEHCEVDLVHDHTCAGPLLARGRSTPTVVTVHGPVTGAEGDYYRALEDTAHLIAISDAQRATAPDLAWKATVHNAIDVATYPYRLDKEGFVLFLGRFHPSKAPHLGIDAARAAGLPIVLAGKCTEPIERTYFDEQVKPRLGPDTDVIGVADTMTKRDLLSRAQCLVFPIRWDEPFGLVMIEAMACGTPVVALRRGSVPEILIDGRTGIICDGPDELADGIARARRLGAAECRSYAETAFDLPTMGTGYELAYHHLLAQVRESASEPPPANSLGDRGFHMEAYQRCHAQDGSQVVDSAVRD